MNNTNKHTYMQAVSNVMFTQMHANKGIKLFYERSIAAMIKEFRQLDEGAMPVKLVVVLLNPD